MIMTDKTSLARLLNGVPRYRHAYKLTIQPSEEGEYVRYSDILAALSAAPHVNETPKSEHDAGDVLTAQPVPDAGDDDPECTCCGGTGITYQTERLCACQAKPDRPNHAYRVGFAVGRAVAICEAAGECDRLRASYARSADSYADDDPEKRKIKWGGAAVAVAAENILALLDKENPHE